MSHSLSNLKEISLDSDFVFIWLAQNGGLLNTTDVLKFDRKLHSAYVKWCQSCDLTVPLIDVFDTDHVDYYHHLFFFMINKKRIVYDWTLSPKDTDYLFKLAAKTQKTREKEKKMSGKSGIKSGTK